MEDNRHSDVEHLQSVGNNGSAGSRHQCQMAFLEVVPDETIAAVVVGMSLAASEFAWEDIAAAAD